MFPIAVLTAAVGAFQAPRVSVDRHHTLQSIGKTLHEPGKTGGKRHWIERPEHPAEGVMAETAVAQAQKLPKERLLGRL